MGALLTITTLAGVALVLMDMMIDYKQPSGDKTGGVLALLGVGVLVLSLVGLAMLAGQPILNECGINTAC